MEQKKTEHYQCPSCGAPLKYHVDGYLFCDSCETRVELDQIEHLSSAAEGEETEFDWGNYKENFVADKESLVGMKVYLCESCGAAIETDGTTSATHCPYCDSEIVVTDKLSGGIKPNGILPFAVTREKAEEAVKAYFKGKKLLPKNFFTEHRLEKMTGIYVPFWLFDSAVSGSLLAEGTRTQLYSDSRYHYTKTEHYLIDVAGQMHFSRIPVDGSEKMDDDLMDAIEPFDYRGLREFDPAYLSGYLADRFDDDPDESLPRASQRMQKSTESVFYREANDGFGTLRTRSSNFNLLSPNVKYVLAPVYLMNLYYGDKRYRFAVNGQTGKVVGELPVSKAKKFWYFVLPFVCGTVLTTLVLTWLFSS